MMIDNPELFSQQLLTQQLEALLHWREKMNTEEREYRGTYLIKIRKDGRIRIPADLKWNHGDWLELTAYGFKDSIFITHIRNIHEVARFVPKEDIGGRR